MEKLNRDLTREEQLKALISVVWGIKQHASILYHSEKLGWPEVGPKGHAIKSDAKQGIDVITRDDGDNVMIIMFLHLPNKAKFKDRDRIA